MFWKLIAIGALLAVVWVLAVVYSPMPRTHALIAYVAIALGLGLARLAAWTAGRAAADGDEPLARGIRERSERIALRFRGSPGAICGWSPPPESAQALALRGLASLGLGVPRAAERLGAMTGMGPSLVARMLDELGQRRWAVPLIDVPGVAPSPATRYSGRSDGDDGLPPPVAADIPLAGAQGAQPVLESIDRAAEFLRLRRAEAQAAAVAEFAADGRAYDEEQRGSPPTHRARRGADAEGDETQMYEPPVSGRVCLGETSVIHRVAPWARATECGLELAERARSKAGEGASVGGEPVFFALEHDERVTCRQCLGAGKAGAA